MASYSICVLTVFLSCETRSRRGRGTASRSKDDRGLGPLGTSQPRLSTNPGGAHSEEPIDASDPDPGDRGVGHQRQAFARAVVDHDEDAQGAAIDKLIGNEVG